MLPRRIDTPLLLLCALALPASASFQSTPGSIKAEGLGGAYVAMADEAATIFHNPAGLSTLERPEASMMYGSPMSGLEGISVSESYLAIGAPVRGNLSAGFGVTMFNASGLLREYQILAGTSYRWKNAAFGANLAYLYHSYTIGKDPFYSGSPAFANGTSKGAVGLDLGAMVFVNPRLQLGMAIRNINSPDVGLVEKDPVSRRITFGGLYRFRYAKALLDIQQRENPSGISASQGASWRVGVEVPVQLLAFRVGGNSNAFTAGFGIDWNGARFDYAFSMLSASESSNLMGHRMSVSYKLGSSQPRAKAARRKESRPGPSGAGAREALAQGDFEAARARLQEASDWDPGDKDAAERLRRVKAVTAALPQARGGEDQAVFARKGVISFVHDLDAKAAVPMLRRAYYANTRDDRVLSVLNAAERAAKAEVTQGGASETLESFVQRKLQGAQDAVYQSQFELAVRRTEEAIQLDPKNVRAWELQGTAYFLLRDKSKAKAAWERCLKLDPRNSMAQEYLRKL